jgi:hypothetical protein
VGRACSTHLRGEKSVQGFDGKARRKKDHLEDQGVGGKMGSEWIFRRLAWGGVDWIRLAHDRDRWQAVASAVMNLRVLAPLS